MNAGSAFPRFAHCLLLVYSRGCLGSSLWSALLNRCKLLLISTSYNFSETVKLNLKVFIVLIITCTVQTYPRCPLWSVSIGCLLINTINHLRGRVVKSLKSVELIVKYSGMPHMMSSSSIIVQETL